MTLRHALLALLALAIAGCCFRPPIETRIANLKTENKRLGVEVKAAEQLKAAQEDYMRVLKQGPGNDRRIAMYYTSADLNQFAKRMLPHKINARDFDKNLSGNIIVERVTSFTFHPGNRVTSTAHIRGENIQYKGKVPEQYKGHVKRFKEGIAAGATAELDSVLVLQGNRIDVHTKCTSTHLKRNSSSLYEGQLKDGMNRRALKKPLRIDVSIEQRTARTTSMMVTGNHVIVFYRP